MLTAARFGPYASVRSPELVLGVVLALLLALLPLGSALAAPTQPVVTGPSGPVAVGDPVGFTSDAAGEGFWDLGDGSTSVAPAGGVSHTYTAAGVHAVTLTVTDPSGAVTSDVVDVVVYDPDSGFVTGGGWITSPAGSHVLAPGSSGRASFGFVSRYKRGRSTPDGTTTFVLHGDDLRLQSTDLDWMVISGSRVQLRGAGRVDGVEGHTFRLHGVDGDLGGDDPDRFRIQVWDPAGELVYDNERGASPSADATTVLGGGQIVIHDPRDGAPVDQQPVADAGPDRATSVDVPVQLDGSGSRDPDGEPLSFAWSLASGPDGATVALDAPSTAAPTFTADTVGTYLVRLVVSDGTRTDADTVAVVVEPATGATPVAVDDRVTTPEDTPVTVDVLANDSDADGDPLEVVRIDDPVGATAELQPDGTVRVVPEADRAGEVTFGYVVTDGVTEVGATVVVTVTPVDDPPVAGDDTATTTEDTPVDVPVLANDTDADGDPLEIAELGATTGGTARLLEDGVVRVVPDADTSGLVTLTYVVRDTVGGGTDEGGVTVTVTPVDDPAVARDDVATTDEDVAVTVDVLANDVDVDGPLATLASVGAADAGSTSLQPDGTVRYVPDPDAYGPDAFSYTLVGGATATVRVSVLAVPDVPDAVDDAVTTPEDTAVTVDVLANDVDVDGDVLEVVRVAAPVGADATVLADGRVTLTPPADVVGDVVFTYEVSDGTSSDTADVVVTVLAVGDAPVAVDDAVGTDEDVAVRIAVLANDTDVDSGDLSVASVGTPSSGTVVLDGDVVVFTPAPDANGVVTFTYVVTDGTLTDTGSVTVTVLPVNDAPVAVDDAVGTDEDVPVRVDVLGDDLDVDGDALSIASVGTPTSGSVVVVDGELLFTPAPDANGVVLFAYVVTDGTLADTGIVTIEVAPVDDAPVAADDATTTPEDTAVVVDVLANDEDVDDALVVTAVTQPEVGTVALDGGVVSFTPAPDATGPATFTYTATGGALQATATVTVDVTPVNDAPVAVALAGPTVTAGDVQPLTFDGTASSDVDGDTLGYAWTITSLPDGSTATLVGATTATPTLRPDLPGTYAVELVVDDGALTDVATASTEALAEPITVSVRDPLIGVARSTPGEVVLPDSAPAGGLVVDVSVDEPTVATLDVAQVVVAAGETTASFTVTGDVPGTVTVTGTPLTTYGPGTVDVEVTPVFLSIGDVITIGPEEQASVPLSVSQADPSDLTVSLRTLDDSIATVEPTSVIPGGRLAPLVNPQVTGVALGLTEVVVEAPGVAPDRRVVEVALGGDLAPTSIRQPVGRSTVATVSVAAPAPTGGLELDVSLSDAVADVPSTVTIAAGQLQTTFEVVGTQEGTATLVVDGIGFEGVQASVRTDPPPSLGFTGGTLLVGSQLQVRGTVRLGYAADEPIDVTVTTDDPGVLVSAQPDAIGARTLVFEALSGFATRSFYVQAPGGAGTTATVTIDAGPLWQPTTRTVEVVDSSVRFSSASPYEVVTLEPVDRAVTTLRPEALVRPGATSERNRWQAQNPIGTTFGAVTVTSTDDTLVLPADCAATAGATAFDASFAILGGLLQGVLCVDGIAVTDGLPRPSLVAVQPPGFVTSAASSLGVDVVAAEVVLNDRATVPYSLAPGLPRGQRVELSYAPPAPVDITLTVPGGSGLTLSATPDRVGTETLVLPGVSGTTEQTFWVHADAPGLGLVGPVTASADPTLYDTDTVSVSVQHPSLVLTGGLRAAAATAEATRSITGAVGPAVVDAAGTILGRSSLRYPLAVGPDGLGLDVAVGDQTVIATQVAGSTVSGETASVWLPPGAVGGTATGAGIDFPSIVVEGRNDGTTTVAVSQPPGFVAPLDAQSAQDEDAIEVTVVGRPIYTHLASARVGLDLQAALTSSRTVDVPLTFTVADPAVASLTGPAGGEVTSLTLPAGGNARQVAVNGLAKGTTVIELRAEGYTPFDLPVTVGDSTVYLSSGLPTTLDRFDPDLLVNLTTGLLVPDFSAGPRVFQQPLRPLADAKVAAVVSDTPSVLAVVGSPVTVDDTVNQFAVDPQNVGFATVTVQQPPGFTTASYVRDSGTVEVLTDDVRRQADISLGVDHRDVLSILIDNPVPDDRSMTVRSSAPGVVSVSADPSVGGAAVAERLVTAGDGVRIGGFTLHALAPGSAQVTIQLPGYNDSSFDVVVHPSTVQWSGTPSTTVTVDGTRLKAVELVGYTPSGARIIALDGIRPGAGVTVDITSDDATVAAPLVPGVTLDGQPSYFVNVPIEGVTAGSTVLRVAPPPGRPGYEPPRTGELTVTVS